jgi:hypothetical protein
MTFLERAVNGQPGLVAGQDGVTVTVFAFDVAGRRIRHIWVYATRRNSGSGRVADARLASLRSAERPAWPGPPIRLPVRLPES